MGEAKRKEATLRAVILKECELWDKPGTPEEAANVAEILELPVVAVRREAAERLAWAGMQPRECHANCIWYAENDPTRQTEHVVGWWRQGDIFALHSVIRTRGEYMCITPQERDVPPVIPFIPDAKIMTEPEGELLLYVRNGLRIGAGFRIDPAAHRASIVLLRERVQAGMRPWQAMHLADKEACERLGIDY